MIVYSGKRQHNTFKNRLKTRLELAGKRVNESEITRWVKTIHPEEQKRERKGRKE